MADRSLLTVAFTAHIPPWFLPWAWRYVDRQPDARMAFIQFMAHAVVRVEIKPPAKP